MTDPNETLQMLAFTVTEQSPALQNMFDGPFCTFHAGHEEAETFSVGDIIGFSVNGRPVDNGQMRVKAVHTGLLGPLALQHADENHGVRHFPQEERPAELRKVMERIYGPEITSDGAPFTVIYLEIMAPATSDDLPI